MSDLYPLLLTPEFRERVWGTRDLSPIYSRKVEGEPIGEVWLTGDSAQVANGLLRGKTLEQLCGEFGEQLVGTAAPDSSRFPLLIKLLFPREKLSVQVHPDDAAARKAGQPCGKTECWYVLSAEPGAELALGVKPGVSLPDVERAIRETHMEEVLNRVPVSAGDMIYVDAGTIHAIGPGSVLVETQQNSDTTYRLYDYGRERELHVREGLAATRLRTSAGKVSSRPTREGRNLVSSPCFTVDRIELASAQRFENPQAPDNSPHCLIAVGGSGTVRAQDGEPAPFRTGEAVVVPAALSSYIIEPKGRLELLRSSLPTQAVQHPETVLVASTT